MKEICNCVISVTERNNVSTSLLYVDMYVPSCALSLKALRLVLRQLSETTDRNLDQKASFL